jgi:rod shape-determining protein MreC
MFKFVKSFRFSVVLLAVVFLLIFLHYLNLTGWLENSIVKMFSPAQSQIYSWGTGLNNFYSNLFVKKDFAAENQRLSTENQNLIIENSQLKTRLAESDQINAAKNYLSSRGLTAITARIIGKSPEPDFQSIILDKGSQDGIRADLPLITADGAIVGKIFRVKNNSAEAILETDSRSRIAAVIQNSSNSQGVVIGEHGLSLTMELIPKDDVVNNGDIVITSGLEPTIPRGLLIGKISSVFSPPNSFFQTARIQSLVKVDSLVVVSVLKSPNYD